MKRFFFLVNYKVPDYLAGERNIALFPASFWKSFLLSESDISQETVQDPSSSSHFAIVYVRG